MISKPPIIDSEIQMFSFSLIYAIFLLGSNFDNQKYV